MPASQPPNSYDNFPYPRLSHKDTHPDRLYTQALLLGLNPPPIQQCRILEIGCASGGNIIPMAYTLPGSKFLGIDISERQIREGQDDIKALGIQNVSLLKMDIKDIEPSFGEFDYILAHGVYSWVSPDVRDKLLSICDKNLSVNGIAFVSYNVYPGWHMIDPIRQMMLYHTRENSDLDLQATRGVELLDFLSKAIPPDTPYGANIQSNYEYLSRDRLRNPKLNKSLLIHDHLSEYNEPVYFYRFIEHVEKHGLQYLCDSELHTDFLSGFQPENREKLLAISHDLVELEQYMDFIRNKRFRRSLLVHKEMEIDRQIKFNQLLKLWIGSSVKPETTSIDISHHTPEKFKGHDEAALTLSNPLSKAAMICMAHWWPAHVPFQKLVEESKALLSALHSKTSQSGEPLPDVHPDEEMVSVLAADLLQAYIYSDSLVEFHACEPPFTLEIERKPLASVWSRHESYIGTMVTNLRHERVDLDIYEIHLLRLLDGNHDREEILTALEENARTGEIVIQEQGQPIKDHQRLREVLSAVLDSKLQQLARAALLMAQ
jgi:methyltransferase-like protein